MQDECKFPFGMVRRKDLAKMRVWFGWYVFWLVDIQYLDQVEHVLEIIAHSTNTYYNL